jgi:hypothetical protein
MAVNLPAARTARPARDNSARAPGTLLRLVAGRGGAVPEPGWRLAMAAALGQLPSGACLTVRDTDGREWCIGPAARATAASFGEAV